MTNKEKDYSIFNQYSVTQFITENKPIMLTEV